MATSDGRLLERASQKVDGPAEGQFEHCSARCSSRIPESLCNAEPIECGYESMKAITCAKWRLFGALALQCLLAVFRPSAGLMDVAGLTQSSTRTRGAALGK